MDRRAFLRGAAASVFVTQIPTTQLRAEGTAENHIPSSEEALAVYENCRAALERQSKDSSTLSAASRIITNVLAALEQEKKLYLLQMQAANGLTQHSFPKVQIYASDPLKDRTDEKQTIVPNTTNARIVEDNQRYQALLAGMHNDNVDGITLGFVRVLESMVGSTGSIAKDIGTLSGFTKNADAKRKEDACAGLYQRGLIIERVIAATVDATSPRTDANGEKHFIDAADLAAQSEKLSQLIRDIHRNYEQAIPGVRSAIRIKSAAEIRAGNETIARDYLPADSDWRQMPDSGVCRPERKPVQAARQLRH